MNLFVYNSLQAAGQEGWMLGSFRRFPGAVKGRLYRMPNGSVVLVPDPHADWVEGEYVEGVTPEHLALVEQILTLPRTAVDVRCGLRLHAAETHVQHDAEARGGRRIQRWRNVRRR